jgi:hypothetical protein
MSPLQLGVTFMELMPVLAKQRRESKTCVPEPMTLKPNVLTVEYNQCKVVVGYPIRFFVDLQQKNENL